MKTRFTLGALSSATLVALTPLVVAAQSNTGSSANSLTTTVQTIGNVVNALVPVAFSAAILFFIWGVAMYIMKPEDKSKAINTMVGGVIGIAVIASLWGLVNVLQNTFNVSSQSAPTSLKIIPTVK